MSAAPLLLVALFAGPVPAPAQADGDEVAYMTSMTFYGGEMPAEGTGGCKVFGRPEVMATAGRCAKVLCGGTCRVASPDGTEAEQPFGLMSEVTVTSAGSGLVRVVVMASSSDQVADVPSGSPRRIHLHGRARFSGVVPLNEPFRFGANGVWAEMRVSHFDLHRPAQARTQTARGEDISPVKD